MTKQYISILELLPKLIKDCSSENGGNLFPFSGRQHHYYDVTEAETPDKKKLTFSRLDQVYEELAEEEAERQGHTHYRYGTYGKRDNPPYIMGESYEVPHLLEIEYLKESAYKEILTDEYVDYIENILYQYILYYERINYEERPGERGHLYSVNNEDSELYRSIQPFIQIMDENSDNFKESVQQIILENYKELGKMKKLTKKELLYTPRRMFATRNLTELIEVANLRPAPYSSEPNAVSQSEHMSQSIPLLMLYSLLAQETNEMHYPTYRIFRKEFEDYPYAMKEKMREHYTHEDLVAERLEIGGQRNSIEDRIYLYTYGNIPRNSSMYISSHDERMNNHLFPYIMNQIRIAGFEYPDRMIIPQGLINEFIDEPWSQLVKQETIVYSSQLEWSEAEE